MHTADPCKFCGCTETNLMDGFYYCAECGTQDTNVRETLIEFTILRDGEVGKGSRKRITQIPKAKEVEMTEDWYKWHTLNFLLQGLADQLIELGASPSFKTKLLWVWTRYMKKYQNKADFGLPTNEESENEEEERPTINEDAYSDEDDETPNTKSEESKLNIKNISMPLVISFLYVALNLDKSHMQLSHLLRFMMENRVSITNWRKLVPQELRPNKLRKSLFFDYQCFRFSHTSVRVLSLSLFRQLDLGNPIVPDLRPLLDEYLQELCLPKDLKPLILSLMHYRSFDYLDINVQYTDVIRMPCYELYVMSHILMALKICFSLDCEYVAKVSDAVDKINDQENYPRSYNISGNPEPTDRLFSFRKWCSYMQFRKTLLKTHSLYLGAPNYFDMNDYVAMDHLDEKPDYKSILKDEITANVIEKIESGEVNIIPRSEFVATLTPHSTYTRVILEHLQDPEVKQLLGEDFTQYSTKYITQDLFLVDPESPNPVNILTGVSKDSVEELNEEFFIGNRAWRAPKGMVYVKNCDNPNWTTTQRPTLEHVTIVEKHSESDEKDKDRGYESNLETTQTSLKTTSVIDDTKQNDDIKANTDVNSLNNYKKDKNDGMSLTDNEMDIDIVDEKTIDISKMDIEMDNKELETINIDIQSLKINEEIEGKNIFDDDFLDLEIKKEEEMEPDCEFKDIETPCEVEKILNIPDVIRHDVLAQDYYTGGKDSDASSVDSIRLNPDSLDRREAINELIKHACNKYKISIPGQYIHRTKKTLIQKRPSKPTGPKRPFTEAEAKTKINGLIAAYHSHVEQDIFHQMSAMVQSAIADFNHNNEKPASPVTFEEPPDEVEPETENISAIEIQSNTTQEPEIAEAIADDAYKLFGDSSDGETYAEELLPKKNPDFDEKTHDISQLYIKPAENPGVPEMELNPRLDKIVTDKIEADEKDPTLLEWQPKEVKERSDSEEDVPLSLLQEQKLIREQLTTQAKLTRSRTALKPLILNDDAAPYNYWLRHYKYEVTANKMLNQRFVNEMNANIPKCLAFVLEACSDVVGYQPFNLYKTLQNNEFFLKHRYLKRKRNFAWYSEREKAKKCRAV